MNGTKFDERLGEDGIRQLREKVRWFDKAVEDYGSLDQYFYYANIRKQAKRYERRERNHKYRYGTPLWQDYDEYGLDAGYFMWGEMD